MAQAAIRSVFSLYYEKSRDFAVSQWQSEHPSRWYAIYKLVALVMLAVVFSQLQPVFTAAGNFSLYLPLWSAVLLCLTVVLQLLLAFIPPLGFVYYIEWLMENISYPLVLYLSVFHFTIVVPDATGVTGDLRFRLVFIDLLSLIFVLVDTFICRCPKRLSHAIYAALFGCIYAIGMGVAYYNLSSLYDFDHYKNLLFDWGSPRVAAVATAKLVALLPISQCFFCMLTATRQIVYERCFKSKDEDGELADMPLNEVLPGGPR